VYPGGVAHPLPAGVPERLTPLMGLLLLAQGPTSTLAVNRDQQPSLSLPSPLDSARSPATPRVPSGVSVPAATLADIPSAAEVVTEAARTATVLSFYWHVPQDSSANSLPSALAPAGAVTASACLASTSAAAGAAVPLPPRAPAISALPEAQSNEDPSPLALSLRHAAVVAQAATQKVHGNRGDSGFAFAEGHLSPAVIKAVRLA
jgi:hypothetical protein